MNKIRIGEKERNECKQVAAAGKLENERLLLKIDTIESERNDTRKHLEKLEIEKRKLELEIETRIKKR